MYYAILSVWVFTTLKPSGPFFFFIPLPLALGTQVLLTFPPGDVEFCMTRSLLGCLLKPRRCWLCDEIIGVQEGFKTLCSHNERQFLSAPDGLRQRCSCAEGVTLGFSKSEGRIMLHRAWFVDI